MGPNLGESSEHRPEMSRNARKPIGMHLDQFHKSSMTMRALKDLFYSCILINRPSSMDEKLHKGRNSYHIELICVLCRQTVLMSPMDSKLHAYQ